MATEYKPWWEMEFDYNKILCKDYYRARNKKQRNKSKKRAIVFAVVLAALGVLSYFLKMPKTAIIFGVLAAVAIGGSFLIRYIEEEIYYKKAKDYWNRNPRQVKFYDDHLEITEIEKETSIPKETEKYFYDEFIGIYTEPNCIYLVTPNMKIIVMPKAFTSRLMYEGVQKVVNETLKATRKAS